MLNRREFLRLGSSLALGLGLGQLSGCGTSNVLQDGGAPSQLPWGNLQRVLQGPLLLPGAPGFDQASAPWNLIFSARRPAAIARCLTAADVSAALQWAQANQVPLVARSGGHSYAGYSTTTGLMIDVSLMNSATYDAASGIVVLGGGARNADVYANLRAPSVAITHGRCKPVGVAGLTLGGGIGFNMRAHGLTCDQLLETEVVLADGTRVVCNPQQNADLFWACRGAGGGNFGIHTSFTFQTYPVSNLTVFKIDWNAAQPQVFNALLTLLQASPTTLGVKLSATVTQASPGSNAITVTLLGQLRGTPAELAAILAPAYAIRVPSQETIRVVPYWDGQDFLSEDGTPEYSHERSRYVFQPISQAGQDTIFQFLQNWPGTRVAGQWKMFLQGGAVAAIAPPDTAFVHRQALMISSVELNWEAADSGAVVARNQDWLDQFHQAMAPFTSNQCYQNFIDGSQQDFLRAYYGANLERLVSVKKHYDPRNVFQYPQSIPLQL